MADEQRNPEEPEEQPGRLRSPLLDDGQPAFHWWLLLPGLALAAVWALYGAVSAEAGAGGEFVARLLWPGPAILLVTTSAAWLGWRLDLD